MDPLCLYSYHCILTTSFLSTKMLFTYKQELSILSKIHTHFLDLFFLGPMTRSRRRRVVCYSLISTANNVNPSSLVLKGENRVPEVLYLKHRLIWPQWFVYSSFVFRYPDLQNSVDFLEIITTLQPVRSSSWHHTKIRPSGLGILLFVFLFQKCTHGCH